MRLVVIDTNVVVSAGINPTGAPARLILECILGGQAGAAICPWIAAEYRGVASRQKLVRYGFPPRWLEHLIATSFELPDPPEWPLSIPDPKDAPFLALAHALGAWLVNENLRYFPEAARGGVVVVSPGEYLDRLES